MPQHAQRLSDLSGLQGRVKLDRTLLRDTAVEKLREFIGSGLIPEGTKISEREVSEMLGISRMPARDALMTLEHEGLVENRPDGRYVIRLTEDQVRGFLQVRAVLERLAAELAASNMNEDAREILMARLRDLEDAAARGDPDLCAARDIALHQAIWELSGNAQLLRFLQSMVGVILVETQPLQGGPWRMRSGPMPWQMRSARSASQTGAKRRSPALLHRGWHGIP